MANTPNIRFKGFADDWEQRKFENIAQRISNIGTSNENVPSVEYEDVISEQGLLNKNIHKKESIKTGFKFSEEEVLYGKLRPYLHNWLNPDFQGIAVGDWWVLKPINSDKNFLYRLIQTPQFDDIANQSFGTKMPRADWKLISGTEFCIPADMKEQEKIGACFSNLDYLTTLHQRKCDEVRQLKKFMLEKMFPKSGELIPDIRFAGFTDAWEQRELGDVFEQTVEYINPKEENLELWSVTVESGLIPKTDRYNREALVKKEDKFKAVHPGDIVYNPMNMTIGAVGFNKIDKSVAVSGYYVTMRMKEGFSNSYFNTWLTTPRTLILYKLYATGSLIEKQRLQFPTLSAIKTPMPSFEEQEKIGRFFVELDKTITLHQRKCDELKEVKRFMLQNMFPQKG